MICFFEQTVALEGIKANKSGIQSQQGRIMKYIVILLIALSIYDRFISDNPTGADTEVKTIEDVKHKLEYASVSSQEVLTSATELAERLCLDTSFQTSIGEDTNSCQERLSKFKSVCADYVFGKETTYYKSNEKVNALTDRFIRCVST